MRRLVVIPGRHDAQSPHNHRITIQKGAAPTPKLVDDPGLVGAVDCSVVPYLPPSFGPTKLTSARLSVSAGRYLAPAALWHRLRGGVEVVEQSLTVILDGGERLFEEVVAARGQADRDNSSVRGFAAFDQARCFGSIDEFGDAALGRAEFVCQGRDRGLLVVGCLDRKQ